MDRTTRIILLLGGITIAALIALTSFMSGPAPTGQADGHTSPTAPAPDVDVPPATGS